MKCLGSETNHSIHLFTQNKNVWSMYWKRDGVVDIVGNGKRWISNKLLPKSSSSSRQGCAWPVEEMVKCSCYVEEAWALRTREIRNAFMWDTAFTQNNCSNPISDKVEAHDIYKKEHQARQGSQQSEAQRMKPICMDAWKKHRADAGKVGLGHTVVHLEH